MMKVRKENQSTVAGGSTDDIMYIFHVYACGGSGAVVFEIT